MICIIVTGSQEWKDEATMDHVLTGYARFASDSRVLIHGAARGADTMADGYAHMHICEVWNVIAMPAQWERDGKAAGPIRNQRMLDVGLALQACGYDLFVEAFPMPSSRGTWDLVRRAEKAGVRVNINKPGSL